MSSIKEEYFKSEEEAANCARQNEGIHYREDWKTLGPERHGKAWVAKYGPGIQPPAPPVPVVDTRDADIATLKSLVSDLQSQLASITTSKRGRVKAGEDE